MFADERIMKSNFDEEVAIRLGKNKNTSADVLKTLIGKSDKVDRLIAQHPNADGAVLSGLSGSLDIKTFKHLLLNNPNTPFETILTVASSLLSGKDSTLIKDSILAELKRLLPDSPLGYSISVDKFAIDSPDILPPGVQRTYRLPDSAPIVRELLHNFFKNPDHEQLAIQLAKDKKTSASSLNTLLGHCTSVDRLIAKHPNADEYVLEQLSGSKDVPTRKNVFLNPNASVYMIVDLAPEFPDKFIKLPSLDRIVTGHGWTGPGLIYRIGQSLLIKILSSRNCPQILFNWTCKHGGALEQLAVWKNIFTPMEVLTEMMETGYAQEANVLLAHQDKLLEFASDLGIVEYDFSDMGSSGKLNQRYLFCVLSDEISELWKKLVPKEGEAKTIQGEMVRAICRIKGDYYRNGFGNWYPMYYELSQFLAAHLIDENTFKPFTLSVLRADIRALNLCGNGVMASGDPAETIPSIFAVDSIEEAFTRLDAAIVAWCKHHTEPIPYNRSN